MNEILLQTGTSFESVKESFTCLWTTKIIKQANLERNSNSRLHAIMNTLPLTSGKDIII